MPQGHTNHKKRQPRVGLALFMLVFGGFLLFRGVSGLLDDTHQVVAPRGRINAEFVETPELREMGLSGREGLGRNNGMLFVFDNETVNRCFWMKDMKFSIDMIWLDSDKKVVHIQENVSPDTYPESYCPDAPAQYVLEVEAGRAEQLGIDMDGGRASLLDTVQLR